MFTGIVRELGRVQTLEQLPGAARLTVRGPALVPQCHHGDSVAVNGVCLTATEVHGDTFTADVMAETLQRTNLGALLPGSPVNLELPMAADGRFGGHMVSGHVDATGHVRDRQAGQHWEIFVIEIPSQLSRYLVAKGSVTVDGVSLTVVEVGDYPDTSWFSVSLIPTTLAETTLGQRQPGDAVNIEVDVLAKYVERLLAVRR